MCVFQIWPPICIDLNADLLNSTFPSFFLVVFKKKFKEIAIIILKETIVYMFIIKHIVAYIDTNYQTPALTKKKVGSQEYL